MFSNIYVIIKEPYNRRLGSSAGQTLRLAEKTSGCGRKHKPKNEVFIADSWFSSVKTCVELTKRGFKFMGQVKTAHRNFPKKHLEDFMVDMAPGNWCVLKTTIQLDGNEDGLDQDPLTIFALGYKYCYSKVLCFVMDATVGSVRPGNPYKACYWSKEGAKTIKYIPRPKVLNQFFGMIGTVDAHNLARQGTLKLEKRWRTRNPYFRIFTSFLGVCITDSWRGRRWNARNIPGESRKRICLRNKFYDISVREYADALSSAILRKYYCPKTFNKTRQLGAEVEEDGSVMVVPPPSRPQVEHDTQSLSSASLGCDRSSQHHTLMRHGVTASGRQGRHRCRWCWLFEGKTDHHTAYYCKQCDRSFCVPSTHCQRNCYKLHWQYLHEWKSAENVVFSRKFGKNRRCMVMTLHVITWCITCISVVGLTVESIYLHFYYLNTNFYGSFNHNS